MAERIAARADQRRGHSADGQEGEVRDLFECLAQADDQRDGTADDQEAADQLAPEDVALLHEAGEHFAEAAPGRRGRGHRRRFRRRDDLPGARRDHLGNRYRDRKHGRNLRLRPSRSSGSVPHFRYGGRPWGWPPARSQCFAVAADDTGQTLQQRILILGDGGGQRGGRFAGKQFATDQAGDLSGRGRQLAQLGDFLTLLIEAARRAAPQGSGEPRAAQRALDLHGRLWCGRGGHFRYRLPRPVAGRLVAEEGSSKGRRHQPEDVTDDRDHGQHDGHEEKSCADVHE